MAINRALSQYFKKSLSEFASLYNSSKSCIFISHKSDDLEAAKKIGDYILNYANIDIYLDCKDGGLLTAVNNNDDEKIVTSIENGLRESTNLLCLISDKTYTSWWVPYEIGIVKSTEKDIASLKLKNIDDVPSFLKIENVLLGTKSLNQYLKAIMDTQLLVETAKLPANTQSPHPLDNYLEWKL